MDKDVIQKKKKDHFIGGLSKEDKYLILPVSLYNPFFRKDKLNRFIDLVNKHSTIIGVTIFIGIYSYRHYIGENKAIEEEKKWIEKYEPLFEKSLKCSYKIKSIKNYILEEKGFFSAAQKKIQHLYEQDTDFLEKIALLASTHANKADKKLYPEEEMRKKQASLFALEECAYFIATEGIIVYPSPELNAAAKYAIEHFKSNLKYIGYNLVQHTKLDCLSLFFNNVKKLATQPPNENISDKNSEFLNCAIFMLKASNKKQASFIIFHLLNMHFPDKMKAIGLDILDLLLENNSLPNDPNLKNIVI